MNDLTLTTESDNASFELTMQKEGDVAEFSQKFRPGGRMEVEFAAAFMGPPGAVGNISLEPNNRLIEALGGLYVPDVTVDAVAYYILAKG